MKTQVTATSIEQYHNVPTTDQQRHILMALDVLHVSCIADIAKYLGWERSTVSGRMNELKKLGLVSFVGKFKSKHTGVMSEHWVRKTTLGGLF